jgi:photosystem II stability/assembly factor-like uncharacterized protein
MMIGGNMKNKTRNMIILALVILALGAAVEAQAGWRPLESGTDIYLFDVAFANDSVGIAIGPGTTILRTTDGGLNWNSRLLDWDAIFYSADFGQDSIGAILIGGCIAKTTDAGENWEVIFEDAGGYYDIDFLDNYITCAVGCNAIETPRVTLSTDGWLTFRDTAFYVEHGGNYYGGHFRCVGIADSNNICAAAGVLCELGFIDTTAVVLSTDRGQTWNTGFWTWHLLQDIDFPTSTIGYAVGTEGFIVKTTDGGATWDSLSSGVDTILWSISFCDSLTGLAVGDAGTIIATTDGGQNWTAQRSGTTEPLQGVEMLNANVAYVAGGSGTILYTENGGWPSVGCNYVIGDINGNGSANGIDVTYGVTYLKGGDAPRDSCDCPPLAYPFYAAGDVNGNCAFNGIDITYYVAYLKQLQPALYYCPDCPPRIYE